MHVFCPTASPAAAGPNRLLIRLGEPRLRGLARPSTPGSSAGELACKQTTEFRSIYLDPYHAKVVPCLGGNAANRSHTKALFKGSEAVQSGPLPAGEEHSVRPSACLQRFSPSMVGRRTTKKGDLLV